MSVEMSDHPTSDQKNVAHGVFFDAVDFDNWEAVCILLKRHPTLRIVVTSRAFDPELAPARIDFQTKEVTLDRGGEKVKTDTASFFKDVRAKEAQPVNREASLKLVRIHLEFMDKYLQAHGYADYKLFNGGYAENPGLTSDIHKLCHLFPNGTDFCTAAEYKAREAAWFDMTPQQRRATFDAVPVTQEYPTVAELVAELRPIAAWFLGPMTAAQNPDLLARVEEAYVMGSCWDATGKSNLMGVCFNYGVDMAAATFVLAALKANPNCRTLFVPTETTKNAVVSSFCNDPYLSSSGVQATGLRDGRTFWNAIKGGPQPPYDAAACVESEKYVAISAVCAVDHAMDGAMALTENRTVSAEEWATAKGFYAVKNPDTPEKQTAIKDLLVATFRAFF
jgi:hypothetical protein